MNPANHRPAVSLRSRLTLGAAIAVAAVVVTSVPACKAFETNLQDTEVKLADSAKQNYDQGIAASAAGRNTEAIKYFEHVKNKYPYSKYAVLAELAVADAQFAREKWIEAADDYAIFARFHPRHEKAAYATFRVALAYFKSIDDDVPFLPTSKEKDQSGTRDAIRSFDEFMRRFPDDELVKEATSLRVQARARLAESDLRTAQFYVERAKWTGAMWRYEHVGFEYADTPKAPSALLSAARIAHDKLHDDAHARELYNNVVDKHAGAPEVKDALAALDALNDSAKSAPAKSDDKGTAKSPTKPEAKASTPAADDAKGDDKPAAADDAKSEDTADRKSDPPARDDVNSDDVKTDDAP